MVACAFSEVPFSPDLQWPRISVVVCSYDGGRTLGECLAGLSRLDYPNYEVIVVDDGSNDATAEIARKYPVRLISTPNRGLSSARNTGLAAAAGEIVAYIDDDAYPDPHWLIYLAQSFQTTNHCGIGGPNLPPPGDGPIADCIAVAPGGPIHVLISDRVAEHIPGCNMAFRKTALESIGGFDTRFRVAGDDVDLCWRLQQAGGTLGFNGAAVVWHHRRNSIRTYWKQQQGYGKAEALLEEKWPEKYNGPGHVNWSGRIYSTRRSGSAKRPRRIFHGVWGSALFQSVYEPAPGFWASVPAMPEWYLMMMCLTALSGIGMFFWDRALVAFPLLLATLAITLVHGTMAALRASFPTKHKLRVVRAGLRALTVLLFLIQPLARLSGRLRHGLTPWRRRRVEGRAWIWSRRWTIWSEQWKKPEDWIRLLEDSLRRTGARVVRGSDFDRWDLDVADGTFGSVRLACVIEEHGAGRQLARFRLSARYSKWALTTTIALVCLAIAAGADGALTVASLYGGLAIVLAARSLHDVGSAMAAALGVIRAEKANIEKPLGLKLSLKPARDVAETDTIKSHS
jgi:GT2 family glycosyltransferase